MSSSTPSTEGSTHTSSPAPSSTRGKTDPAWAYCRMVDGNSKKNLVCMFCDKLFKGGGIMRVKQHLACVKGETEHCKKVPPEVSNEMKQHIEGFVLKKRRVQETFETQNPYGSGLRDYEDEDVQEISPSPLPPPSSKKKGKEKASGGIGSYFVPRTTPGSQPTLKSVLQSKEAKDRVDIAVAKWMIDASIPFNAVNSMFYQPMIDAMISYGGGYKC